MKDHREQPIIIIKKKVHGHGHHGGAWKVAFADFMTAMMAMFLVMWLVTQSSDVRSAIAGYFQDPLGRAKEFGSSFIPGEGAQTQSLRPLRPDDLFNLRRDRLQWVSERITSRLETIPALQKLADQVEITMTSDGLRVELLEGDEGTFFETGSAKPSAAGRELLVVMGAELGRLPNHVIVEGHTDARPFVSRADYSNWELSTDRSHTARRIMQAAGLDGGQIQQVRGYADRDLRNRADPYATENRRVTITVLLDAPIIDLSEESAPSDTSAAPSESPARGTESSEGG